jgi:hypothetical protein
MTREYRPGGDNYGNHISDKGLRWRVEDEMLEETLTERVRRQNTSTRELIHDGVNVKTAPLELVLWAVYQAGVKRRSKYEDFV